MTLKLKFSSTNSIIFNGNTVAAKVIANSTFWNAVKTYQDLFYGLPIKVVKDKQNGKIWKTGINVEMFNEADIAGGWKEIFIK